SIPFLHAPRAVRALHSFPTRRSSDLRIAFFLGLSGDAFKSGVQFLIAMAKAFAELDCSLAEINPLVVTQDGQVVALDAKINFDEDRKSTRLNSSHSQISYAVLCLKKK